MWNVLKSINENQVGVGELQVIYYFTPTLWNTLLDLITCDITTLVADWTLDNLVENSVHNIVNSLKQHHCHVYRQVSTKAQKGCNSNNYYYLILLLTAVASKFPTDIRVTRRKGKICWYGVTEVPISYRNNPKPLRTEYS